MNPILDSYMNTYSLVQHQIDSYNRFISYSIQRIVEQFDKIESETAEFAMKFVGVRFEKPYIIEADSSRRQLFPNEARIRDLTYAARMYLLVMPFIKGVEKNLSTNEVYIGDLPVMLKSDLCHLKNLPENLLIDAGEDPFDPGGYFIIKGTERVLIGIEDVAPNRIITSKERDRIRSKVFSSIFGFRAKCVVDRLNDGEFIIDFPKAPKNIDFILTLKALGLDEKEIIEYASDHEVFKNDMIYNIEINEYRDITNKEEAIAKLGQLVAPMQAKTYQKKRAEFELDNHLLPHLGTDHLSRRKKAFFILEMAKRTSLVANKLLSPDDKDHYANKRVKFAGELLEDLFTYAFKYFMKKTKEQIDRSVVRGRKLSIHTIVNPEWINSKIEYAMGTGSWVTGQTGVSPTLDRTNYFNTYAGLRRVKSPLSKKHPNVELRGVHGTQYGKICVSETPAGLEVGLTKYLAITAKPSIGVDEKFIEEKLRSMFKIQSNEG